MMCPYLGAYALSPIDVTADDIELTSMEYFRKFVLDTRLLFEELFHHEVEIPKTSVDSEMLVKMVEQVDALEIGALYREYAYSKI